VGSADSAVRVGASASPESPAEPSSRLVIVDRDRLCVETLRAVLPQYGMEVLPATPGRTESAATITLSRPDAVIIDLVDRPEGLRLGETLLERDEGMTLLGLTPRPDQTALRESVRAGFRGCLTKMSSLSSFVAGVRMALAGRVVRPRRATSGPSRRYRSEAEHAASTLTVRERQVLALLVAGVDNGRIAVRMSISPNTVRTHIQSILAKLQVHTRLEAAVWAYQNGLSASRLSAGK
jgi:two-component system, NarL family, nitrate/nitrite response regulator NarL